ncbi:hypothetical protein K439DRAFT_1611790 [Ramaria rubella]|nr:hypothetical protein K439DRAFT_1611790 [Ramaria rubella]
MFDRNHEDEPCTPMHGTKRIRSPTQDVHSSQRRRKHPELLMGYSPTLIGDTPPSKQTSIRLQKPTLVMERVGSNARPHIMTAQHSPPMVHPPADVSTAVDFYDTPNLYQEWLYQHGVEHRLPKICPVTKNPVDLQKSEEDDGSSLADFIVDDEVNEDEYRDVTDKGAVIPGNDAEDILAGSGDQDWRILDLILLSPIKDKTSMKILIFLHPIVRTDIRPQVWLYV